MYRFMSTHAVRLAWHGPQSLGFFILYVYGLWQCTILYTPGNKCQFCSIKPILLPLNTLPHNPDLPALKKNDFENIVGKGENAGHQHFLLFPQCFLPYQRQKLSFQQHLFCRLQNAFKLDQSKILQFGEELKAKYTLLLWVRIHQPFFRTFFVLFYRFIYV